MRPDTLRIIIYYHKENSDETHAFSSHDTSCDVGGTLSAQATETESSMQGFVTKVVNDLITVAEAEELSANWTDADRELFLELYAEAQGFTVEGEITVTSNPTFKGSYGTTRSASGAVHIPRTHNSNGAISTASSSNSQCDGSGDSDYWLVYNAWPNNISSMRWFTFYGWFGYLVETAWPGGLLTQAASSYQTGICVGGTKGGAIGGLSHFATHLRLNPWG